jgi:hypothetical protein
VLTDFGVALFLLPGGRPPLGRDVGKSGLEACPVSVPCFWPNRSKLKIASSIRIALLAKFG